MAPQRAIVTNSSMAFPILYVCLPTCRGGEIKSPALAYPVSFLFPFIPHPSKLQRPTLKGTEDKPVNGPTLGAPYHIIQFRTIQHAFEKGTPAIPLGRLRH
ncbi:hypothetical protein ACRALDRAFT_204912 [Sodiomyces alcalophilus JCM 7366]|uniref:uncharacterized protein n=1 Tax=Sodiomyces alcalophilus JCM 7366 TaxID=591952 RepID=UPI0039B4259E